MPGGAGRRPSAARFARDADAAARNAARAVRLVTGAARGLRVGGGAKSGEQQLRICQEQFDVLTV